ncbi:DEAD/DEAH box helicase [Companilactobacillus sp. DQM5]|uniref:DEAD/DEAH box helicase n=1 Tax=Companilactobacillus sp. DQM5 TaxID=3463359 RepID=UPI0040582D72
MKVPEIFENYFKEKSYKELTSIQEKVYESFKNGENLLAMAPTGSGKTLAFSLPLTEMVNPKSGLQVIILEPSQELAIQTRDVLQPILKTVSAKVMALTGGANSKRQLEKLKKEKPEVIVATIGRLQEMMSLKKVKPGSVDLLVIDEADELLSNIKLEEIRDIVGRVKEDAQITMFSATSNPIFYELHKWFGRDFDIIDDRDNNEYRKGIKHFFIQATNNQDELIRRLAHNNKFHGVVFFNSSRQLHKTITNLNYKKINFVVLDSKSSSQQRKDALNKFSSKKVNLILTNDVAARGIDIPSINTIVNYMIPRTTQEYVHRSGRTGRMGRDGISITFGNAHDMRNFKNDIAKDFDVKQVMITEDGSFTTNIKKVISKKNDTKAKEKKKERWRDKKNKGKRKK